MGKIGESVDWGMDRIDECLNRIDLRNNETTGTVMHCSTGEAAKLLLTITGYFEKVSKKVDELERLQQGKKS